MATPLLSFSHVKKSFDGIFALRDVSFDVFPGECLALVGENGAGKSTLMKILSGVWPHGSYSGEVKFEGKVLQLKSPLEGRRHGISIIHQELCLFPKLSVAENLFLTENYPYDGAPSQSLFSSVRWRALVRKAEALFQELEFDVQAKAIVEDLSVAQQQLVEIARAFHHKAKLLILDEPTSALSQKEVRHLFDVIGRMHSQSMSFIYISHKLEEVFTLADRIVVLRDGQAVANLLPWESNDAEVIRHMVGRELRGAHTSGTNSIGEVVFEVEGLGHTSPLGKEQLGNIHFKVKRGEVLGIAGLMGSGRSELLRSILGVLPGKREGKMRFQGKPVTWNGIDEAMKDGIAFVPEDRKKDGLFLEQGIGFNLTISVLGDFANKGVLDLSKEQLLIDELVAKMGVKCKSLQDPVKVLSGGNQQKVLLAKVVALSPKILMLDEPTRGIDVGAKEEIYDIIRRLAGEGISVVLVSSELPEILALSDRVLVLREGKNVGELANKDLTQEEVMAFAAGTRAATATETNWT